jgi:vancomycin permeability regulator SanA
MMKKIVFLLVITLCLITKSFSQVQKANSDYISVKSNSLLQDKDFYLLTLFQRIKEVSSLLHADKNLKDIGKERIARLNNIPFSCKDSLNCYAQSFLWTEDEITQIQQALQRLYQRNPSLQKLVDEHLRPSGFFQNNATLSDEDLLLKAWQDAAKGMNYIINVYLLNQGARYAAIDSVSYPVNGSYYKSVINEMMFQVKHTSSSMKLFFDPSLQVCLQLLAVNNRDEAIRYEPLKTLNKKAYDQIQKTNFNRYPYSVILTLGEGPENNMPISPNNKYRCQTAADCYRRQQAPFIMVSGGHVHPFQTAYCEALEMKKYLMAHFNIPEQAVIVEPYARHTITNFRNANRIIYCTHIPFSKKILCVTSKYHTDYLSNPVFEQRSIEELGYAPFKNIKHVGDFTTEYLPVIESLQVNALDPLDP